MCSVPAFVNKVREVKELKTYVGRLVTQRLYGLSDIADTEEGVYLSFRKSFVVETLSSK